MSENKFVTEKGNAVNVEQTNILETKLVIERMESKFDFYSEEPVSITVKQNENSIAEKYFCIFRVRIWNSKNKCFSWSIYSVERECLNSLVVRRVIWDLERDTKTVQENIQENRERLLTLWPTLDICNKYLSSKQACLIIRSMSNLDEKIGKGFILNENNNPDWKWRDLELVRMYDWGKIHYTWCTDRKNEHVEKEIEKMIIVLNESLDEIQDKIFSMVINYSDFPFPTW